MPYRLMGRVHAACVRPTAGQGTVEYVALILLVAIVLTGVIAAARTMKSGGEIGATIVAKLKAALDGIK